MGETAKELRERGWALRAEAQKLIREAESLFERAGDLDEKGMTDLQSAILHGRKAEAKRLIKAGADPNATGAAESKPPLALAFEADEKDFSAPLALALIKAGADPDAKARDGLPVLALALGRWEFEIALALLKAGAKPEASYLDALPEEHWLEDKDWMARYFPTPRSRKRLAIAEEIRGLLIKKPGKKRETL